MDIAGELLSINQVLRSSKFCKGTKVQDKNGHLGEIKNSRFSILGGGPFGLPTGYGIEYEVRWKNGEVGWVTGDLSPMNFASFDKQIKYY